MGTTPKSAVPASVARKTYLNDVLVVQVWSFSFEASAPCHLEAEEGTHWFLRGISLLLTLLLFLW
jgi:hypothetical protein